MTPEQARPAMALPGLRSPNRSEALTGARVAFGALRGAAKDGAAARGKKG